MTRAALLAGLAAGCGVLALWEALAAIERARLPELVERLRAPLRRARSDGALPTAAERRRLALVAAGSLLAAGWLVAGAIGGLVLALCGPWIALGVLRARRRRYLSELERQAPVVARALADALAGGHSIRGALAEVARASTGAAGAELRRAATALELGEATEAVLERLRKRAGARAYDTMVAAMLLQRDARAISHTCCAGSQGRSRTPCAWRARPARPRRRRGSRACSSASSPSGRPPWSSSQSPATWASCSRRRSAPGCWAARLPSRPSRSS